MEGNQLEHKDFPDHYVGFPSQNYDKCWGTNFYNCLKINENGETVHICHKPKNSIHYCRLGELEIKNFM